MNTITLVGRASDLELSWFEPGATMAAFTLTVKPRGEHPPLVVRCEGCGPRIVDQFDRMDEGSLVGITGSITNTTCVADRLVRDDRLLVRIDRLEYLGKPLAQEVAA